MGDHSIAGDDADELSVIENVEYALDDDLLFSIVGDFLHCDPKRCKLLPDFRIEELLFLCSRSQNSMLNEFKLSDSILALYTLCIYFAMKTTYHRAVTGRFLTLAQHLIVESLVVIQNYATIAGNNNINSNNIKQDVNSSSKRCVFGPLLTSLQKSDEVDVEHKLELFESCLEYARCILRDTIDLHRTMLRVKEMRVEERKAAMPTKTDCLNASSVYFMCSLAVAHVSLVLHSVGNIPFVPGMFETLTIMLYTLPITVSDTSNLEKDKDKDEELTTTISITTSSFDFHRSILYSYQLARFALHVVSEASFLELVSLARGHVSKAVIHPEAAYARYQASSLKAVLDQYNNNSNSNNAVGKEEDGLRAFNKLPVHEPSFHLLNDLPLPLPSTALMQTDQPQNNDSSAFIDIRSTKSATNSRGIHYGGGNFNTNNDGTISIGQDSNPSNSQSQSQSFSRPFQHNSHNINNAQKKRAAHFLNLKRSFREPFLVLEALRQSHMLYHHSRNSHRHHFSGAVRKNKNEFNYFLSCFPEEYRPSLDPQQPMTGPPTTTSATANASAAKSPDYKTSKNLATITSPGKDQHSGRSQYQSKSNTTSNSQAVVTMLSNLSQVNAMSLSAGWSSTAKLKVLTALLFEHCTLCCSPPPIGTIFYLPRVLDPLQPAFYVVQAVLERLLKMAMAGEGICRSLRQEELFLERKLQAMQKAEKMQLDAVNKKKKKSEGVVKSSDTKEQLKLPPIAPSTNSKNNKTAATAINSPPPAASSSSMSSSTLPPTLSLEHRFAAAKREAALESRLHAVSNKIRTVEMEQQRMQSLQIFRLQSQSNDSGDNFLDDHSFGSSTLSGINLVTKNQDGKKGHAQQQFDLSNVKYDQRGELMSVVWYCPPKYKPVSQGHFVAVESLFEFEEDILSHMPSHSAAVEYAKEINERKRQEHAEEVKRQVMMKDQQDAIVARNRAAKTSIARTLRERTKEEIAAKAAMKAAWEAEKARMDAEAAAKAADEERARQEAEMMETLRIAELKAMQNFIKQREEEEHQLELEREKAIISLIVDKAEADEIVRRLEEEARMKYLEERRKIIEDRNEVKRKAKEQKKAVKRQETLGKINLMQHRIRRGNFQWHSGVLGYYDRVRPEEKVAAYIEYDDGYNKPYYVDPITKTAQYRRPDDAEIIHHIDEERNAYDAIYGVGAYDAYMADLAFKQAVNRDGGYFDEFGEWQPAYGYFDEQNDYQWVPYEGYYDDNGKFVKYAKVQGDLSFMV